MRVRFTGRCPPAQIPALLGQLWVDPGFPDVLIRSSAPDAPLAACRTAAKKEGTGSANPVVLAFSSLKGLPSTPFPVDRKVIPSTPHAQPAILPTLFLDPILAPDDISSRPQGHPLQPPPCTTRETSHAFPRSSFGTRRGFPLAIAGGQLHPAGIAASCARSALNSCPLLR